MTASTDVVTIADVRDALAGRRLLQLDAIDDRLVGVSIDRARPVLHDLGPTAGLVALFHAAGRALSRLARSDLGIHSHEAAVQRLADVAAEIDATLSRCWPGDDDVVLVPPPQLYAAPWSLLPMLAARAFTVAASATVWQRAGADDFAQDAAERSSWRAPTSPRRGPRFARSPGCTTT